MHTLTHTLNRCALVCVQTKDKNEEEWKMKFLVRLIFIVILDFPSAASARFAFCLFDDDVVAVVVIAVVAVVAVVIYLHNFNKLFSLFGLTCAWFGLTVCACVDDTAEHTKST